MLLQAPAVLLLAVLFGSTNGLRILVSNDDSWASANVRMLYQALRNAHHDVVLAAPARQQSGRGALRESVQPLGDNSAFGLLKKGTAGLGCDPNDERICWVNSTPVTSVAFGLRHFCPRYFHSHLPDIVITGPNEGGNCGRRCIAVSGTFNAALYALKELDIPAIAVSAANKYGIVRSYQAVQSLDDPAIRFAQDTLAILRALEEASAHRVAMLQQATAPSLQPVPVLASANASAGAGATAGSSSSSTGSTGRISASVTRDSTCVRRVRPLLPPNVGLNINLAYPEDVGDASTERTWLLTRMVEPESRRKWRFLARFFPDKLALEGRIVQSPRHQHVHTISVFETGSPLLEPSPASIKTVANMLGSSLAGFHQNSAQAARRH